MFSPAAQEGGPAKGTRSSRRRQRPMSSDSLVQQPKAKRQRVPLSEATFVNPEAPPETFDVKSDKLEVLGLKRDGFDNHTPARKELSVRSKKPKAGERVSKGDGSVILTTNTAYTVSKLPALPDRIRADSQNRQHGAIFASNGYGLTLTHTHALVWPYTSTTPSPETFTFALPYPSKHASDPLPLATLVSPSASSEEPGLVVVMPVSGKIAYWESISSAATLDFIRQQRTGVEDAIHGMFSGEHVVQLVNAESAGFVLAFSTGRLAYMSVRDGHGRPAISVQFLRNGLGSSSVGFLGSLRNALSTSSLKGDLAAVHANHGTKVGERTIVAATSKGKLHGWRLHRGGHHEAFADVDIRESVVEAAEKTDAQVSAEAFEVLDFAFVPRRVEKKYRDVSRFSAAISSEDDSLQQLLLLVSFGGKRNQQYSLVEVVLSAGAFQVGMVRPITSYATPIRTLAPVKPRIYLPRPALVAFAVFDRAVVVASLTLPPESPESQLQEDNSILPATFEDVVDFRDEDVLEIVGSGMEEPALNGSAADDSRAPRHKTKNPATVLLVRGVGVVRVAIADIERFTSGTPPAVTAKSKLEQAVFFGIKDDNPLVFEGRRDLRFSNKEIGDAAVQLSHEIVSSKTPFICNLPASLESNMRTRINYLERLISHLNVLKVDLDQRTRWLLLWNAEKMTVATLIWKQHEKFLAQRPDGHKKSVVSETAVYINEHQKTEPNSAIGEVDPVRHWFINDVWRLDIFIAWGYQIIKYAYTEHLTDNTGITRLLCEAMTISNLALAEALRYREQHSKLYGVRRWSAGTGLPEPWNATQFIANNMKRMVEFCYTWLDQFYLLDSEDDVDPKLLNSIRMQLPSLTNVYFTALQEYARWAELSGDDQTKGYGKLCSDAYKSDSYTKVLALEKYGLWREAVALAEENRSFDAMARLLVEQAHAKKQQARTHAPQEEATALEREIGDLFDKYGQEFAFPAYEVLLETSGVQAVLDFAFDKKGYATEFLRTRPELAKISWINDVERENDIHHAADTLLSLGLTREQQVWNKKIELSLGKLALLAEEEKAEAAGSISNGDANTTAGLERIDRELEIIKIQDALYQEMLPSFSDAVDQDEEPRLAVLSHGDLIPKKHKVIADIYEDAMVRLVKHEALDAFSIIDLLTLSHLRPEHVLDMGDQFCLALQVAALGLKGEDRRNAERLIWRRCYLRDDWREVNETNNKADIDQLEAVAATAVYSAMFAIATHHKAEDSFYPVMKPSEVAGVYTDHVDRRFIDMDENFRNKLLDAMRSEDTKLSEFIEKHRLDSWHRAVLQEAERTVAREYDLRTQAQAAVSSSNGHANRDKGQHGEGNGLARLL
ncbi:Non-repetitive/WGA-negative nucleoporin C-terminal-domain-containing protein [Coniochaeta sp. 2T2.1]|nr:Non-repetitive/WGA-negative nucleoporin C-terminal-domain-containing protein [Coniochaeta sp. 2T2.1]